MASTEPRSPNLPCGVCSPPQGHRGGWRVLPYGPPILSRGHAFLLPRSGLAQICFFLGGPVPWSDRVSTGVPEPESPGPGALPSRALCTHRLEKHLFQKCFFKKSTKTKPRKKTKSGGERAALLFKAPKSGIGRWCSSKGGRGRAPRGCPAGAFGPPAVSVVRLRELASAAVPRVLGFPRTPLRPHLKGLFRFTSLFVFLYIRVRVHICLYLCRWVCCL